VIFDLAVGAGSSVAPERRGALLGALVKATDERKVRPSGDLERLVRWLDGPDPSLRNTAARAAGAWKVEPLHGRLAKIAGAEESPELVGEGALGGLARFGDRPEIERLASPAGPPWARPAAMAALAALDPKQAAKHAAAWLGESGTGEPATIAELIARI